MSKNPYDEYPYIIYEDIILRRIRETDIESLYEIYGNAKVMNSIPANIKNRAELNTMIANADQDLENKTHMRLGVCLSNNLNFVVGTTKIYDFNEDVNMISMGYIINEFYWNRGIATKVTKAMVEYLLFQIGINRIQAFVLPGNIKSQNVLLKNNFVKEGLVRQGYKWEGRGLVDILMFSLLKSDHRSSTKSVKQILRANDGEKVNKNTVLS